LRGNILALIGGSNICATHHIGRFEYVTKKSFDLCFLI